MSAGGLVGYVINWIMFSVAWSLFGKLMDTIVRLANGIPGMPQDMYNTLGWFVLIYLSGPFLYAIALGINYLVQCNSESSAEV